VQAGCHATEQRKEATIAVTLGELLERAGESAWADHQRVMPVIRKYRRRSKRCEKLRRTVAKVEAVSSDIPGLATPRTISTVNKLMGINR